MCARRSSTYAEAISYYGEAIDAVPGLPHVYLAIGRSYYAQGLLDKAILYYKRALDKDPKFSTLVLGVVQSVPFQMRRGEGDHRKFAISPPTSAVPDHAAPK